MVSSNRFTNSAYGKIEVYIRWGLIFLLFFIPILSEAQQSFIRGVVSIHNSKFETGIRKYVQYAEVSDDFGKAQTTLTNSKGEFNLVFIGVPDQQAVSFKVRKQGLEVVNIANLTAVTGQQDIVNISMALPEKVNEFRKKIYQVGKTEADKKLEALLKKMKSEVIRLKDNDIKNREEIIALQSKIDELENDGKMINETNAQELARRYALLNLDDLNEAFQTAFLAFQNGNLDKALYIINKVNFKNEIDEINESRKITNERAMNTSAALWLKLDIFQLRFLYDSLFQTYQLLIQLNPDSVNIRLEYAQQLSDLGYFQKAITIFKDCVPFAASLEDAERARLFELLGTLHSKIGLYGVAEDYLKKALLVLGGVHVPDSTTKIHIARAKVNLAFVYLSYPNRLIEGQHLLKEAIETYKSTDSAKRDIKLSLASALWDLAIIQQKLSQYDSSKASFIEGIKIFHSLQKLSKIETKSYLTMLNDFTVANSIYGSNSVVDSILRIESPLVNYYYKKYPIEFADIMIHYLLREGSYYEETGLLNKAKADYLLALNLIHQSGDSNKVNVNVIGSTNFTLAKLYIKENLVDSGEIYFVKGLNFFKKYEILPDFVVADCRGALLTLADISFDKGQYDRCMSYLLEAREKSSILKNTRLKNEEIDLMIEERISYIKRYFK